jgi:hypothetical protein
VDRQRPEQPPIHSWFCLLVASPRVQDLLLSAKDLFVAAMAANCPLSIPEPDVCLCIIESTGALRTGEDHEEAGLICCFR